MRVAVDVGGTFTDVAFWDGSVLHTAKVSTTPDQSDGLIAGVEAIGAVGVDLVHGTTAATNAVLQRRGARTAYVTDAGFEDLIEIGRQDRPSLYDTAVTRPEPLAPAGLRFGMPGRATATDPGDSRDLDAVVAAVVAAKPESVAVAMLFGFAHPQREQAVAVALRRALDGVPVSLSSEVAAEIREYERASTTLLNAYLMPVVERYLHRLATRVEAPTTVMRSSGGLIPLGRAAKPAGCDRAFRPGRSGRWLPAALGRRPGQADRGVVRHGRHLHRRMPYRRHGRPEVAYRGSAPSMACPRPCHRWPSTPSAPVEAASEGSTPVERCGWARPAPGPIPVRPVTRAAGCWPRSPTPIWSPAASGPTWPSGEPWFPTRPRPDPPWRGLGAELGSDVKLVALGMIEVVEAHMERAVRRVSVEEGSDPRDAVLIAFGGAGGLHATALARRLGMAGVVVPAHAGVFSALGLLLAPPRVDVSRSVLLTGLAGLNEIIAGVIGEASGPRHYG